MVEHEQRPELLWLQLEPHHRLLLAGELPLVLEHAGLVPRENAAAFGGAAVEVEADLPTGAGVDLRPGEPAPELLRIGQRRPQLRRGEVVEAPELDGAALAVAPEGAVCGLDLAHVVSFRARRSSVSSASSRCAQNER